MKRAALATVFSIMVVSPAVSQDAVGVIEIQSAGWGRDGDFPARSCHMGDITEGVSKKADGKVSFFVTPSNAWTGWDSCPQVPKEMVIRWSCISGGTVLGSYLFKQSESGTNFKLTCLRPEEFSTKVGP